jgi:hypothetical protein
MIILPRQARNKHRENSKKGRVSTGRACPLRRGGAKNASLFAMPFYTTEAIIVPSRARDKHRINSQKRRVFSQLDRHYVYQFCSPTRCAIQTVRAHAHAAAPEGREENTHTHTHCLFCASRACCHESDHLPRQAPDPPHKKSFC